MDTGLTLCPMGCGNATDDEFDGPCSECWSMAGREPGCKCPLDEEPWHHPLTGHCGDCGCLTCSGER